MVTAEAVREVLQSFELSKYALAKSLDMASATSVNQWLRGTRMHEDTASRFTELYGITIDDAFSTPTRVS